jgi:hypothetical protein
MNVSQPVAGRSRDVNATRDFLQPVVSSNTEGASTSSPPSSPYAWKAAFLRRIWRPDGPLGKTASGVLTVLVENSDGDGRTWIGLRKLAAGAKIGNLRTVRHALATLVHGGWLRYTPQTWASLTAEQSAAGRQVPRRGDVGQAPHLYVVLDGEGNPVTPARQESRVPTRTGLAPTSDASNAERLDERDTLASTETPPASRAQESKGDWDWVDAWKLLVHAHAEKTKAVYGVAPLAPDLKRDQRKELAECLDGTAAELGAKLRERGVGRDVADVRLELAERVMKLYFKRDVEHLRKVKHALRDLPREFHARITEAMQAILRESYDAQPPRRTVELEQTTERRLAKKPAETAPPAPSEKPMSLHQINALARQTRASLEASTPKQEPPKRPEPPSTPPAKPVLPDWFAAELDPEQARRVAQRLEETPLAPSDALQAIEQSIGLPGAPRWGTVGPRPTKLRRPFKLQQPDGNGEGEV